MLKVEDIVLAYRLLLGRDPESQAVVNNLCQTVHSIDQLREQFYASPEFLDRMGQLLKTPQNVLQRHPFNLPQIPIQVDCTESKLDEMLLRIANEWEFLGSNDPYWSVITQPQYHLDQFEGHREQFYISGKYTTDIFLASLRRNGINPSLLSNCLDFGCGVGRMLLSLSKAFAKVYQVDVSNNHLVLAKKQAERENISNVEFIHCNNLSLVDSLPNFDALVSVITLQHNPPPVIFSVLKHLLNLLNPGGAAYFQIPTYRNGYLFEIERYLNSPAPNTLEMHFLPQKDIYRAIYEAGCICLEVREDNMVGNENTMLSNSFIVHKPKL